MRLSLRMFISISVRKAFRRGLVSCVGRGTFTSGRHWIGFLFKICLSLEEVAYGELISNYEVRDPDTFLRLLISVFVAVKLRIDGTEL